MKKVDKKVHATPVLPNTFIGKVSSDDESLSVILDMNSDKASEMNRQSLLPLVKSAKLNDNTFFLYFESGEISMVFEERGKSLKLLKLFEILFNHWNQRRQRNENGEETLTREKIKEELHKRDQNIFDIETLSRHGYINDLIGSLRLKIKRSKIADFISIKTMYKNNSNDNTPGYSVVIRTHFNLLEYSN